MLIDTHAHLYAEEFKKDIETVMARLQEAQVEKIYLPNIDHSSIDAMLELEQGYDFCIATMGLHPCSVDKNFEKELYLIENWLQKRFFVAIGEMGTDLYWDKTFWEEQQEAFKIQARWAEQYKIPLIIHSRNSIDETITLIENLALPQLSGVFHCFTGTLEQAKKIKDMGFYLGIGGVVTYKNSDLPKILEQIDLSQLVLETDSPYLPPTPHRGKRNEPAYIKLVAEKLADIYQKSTEEIAQITRKNAYQLFNQVQK
ncbi:MAG: TatD family hydrolase [Thermonemataceae bacterium]|nr:TatD family hydrolase [Thermonemataceae bacterium]